MAFAMLKRFFGVPSGENAKALLAALVLEGRNPAWYRDAGVPDTVDGRFEAMALVTALALLRVEDFGEEAADLFRDLAESFAADMEIQVREIGLGEGVAAKHVGRMMNVLGGRITGLRGAQDGEALAAWLAKTLHAQGEPDAAQIAVAVDRTRALRERFAQTSLAELKAGKIAP